MIDDPSTANVGAVVSVGGSVNARELMDTTRTLLATNKGLLAMDQSARHGEYSAAMEGASAW